MAIIWVVIIVFVYIGLYILNKKTPKPEGCEDLVAECDSCKFYDCTHNQVHKERGDS